MSQLQQVFLQHPRVSPARVEDFGEDFRRYEAFLLSELFRRNGRETSIQTATPPGYTYKPELPPLSNPVEVGGPVVQVAAHPGDGPDFFYATHLKMASYTLSSRSYHEILLTDGARGVDGWSPERTRQTRMQEAYAGAEVVGSKLHFLGYPDGSLSSLPVKRRDQLVVELAETIGEIQPSMLVVHPPKYDHPDHAQSFLLTVAALERYTQAGGSIPALFVHDVEFGLQQKSLWTPRVIDPRTHLYAMHTPDLIVDISSTHQLAQFALHKHQTQMYDPVLEQPKAYADLIDLLARVRGFQFMTEGAPLFPKGQGFSQVIIPGVTNEQNILQLRLPPGSLYRRVRDEALAVPLSRSTDKGEIGQNPEYLKKRQKTVDPGKSHSSLCQKGQIDRPFQYD